MSEEIIEKIDQIFADPKNFTSESVETLVQDTLGFFKDLQQKLASKDEMVREAALQSSFELKEKLEAQARTLYQSLGINEETVNDYLSHPENFLPDELEAMKRAQERIDNFKASLHENK